MGYKRKKGASAPSTMQTCSAPLVTLRQCFMKTILAVDNDPITLQILVGMLKSHSNFFNVIAADNIQQAIEVASHEGVDLVITGMHIPEPDAFQFSLLLSGTPERRIIVISNNASEMFCKKIGALASVIHFDQMLDIRLLARKIFTELKIDYGGQVQGISLSTLLQMLEAEHRSCTLLITAKSNSGTIHLADGRLITAKTDKLSGKAAALVLLNWKNVTIDIDYRPTSIPVEINESLMGLLLESGQFMDETLSQRQNRRRRQRYDCSVNVACLIDEVKCQCYMRDISEGGAYLETEQTLEIGEKIVLTLPSPTGDSPCTVNGTVVRRDNRGVGVQFDTRAPDHVQTIQTAIKFVVQPEQT